jgi:hypothetical protein
VTTLGEGLAFFRAEGEVVLEVLIRFVFVIVFPSTRFGEGEPNSVMRIGCSFDRVATILLNVCCANPEQCAAKTHLNSTRNDSRFIH